MCIETLYAESLDDIDRLIDEFTTDRITYNVDLRKVGMYWQADIFYDNIIEEE